MLAKAMNICRVGSTSCCCNSSRKLPQYLMQAIRTQRIMSTELNAALRPFYFIVHPDLFGQHPVQRSVNEESLKLLTAHIEALHERRYSQARDAKTLEFYIRDDSAEKRDTFKLIKIRIDHSVRDPKQFIHKVLETANLSTEYIKTIKSSIFESSQHTSYGTNSTSGTMYRNVNDYQPGKDYRYGREFEQFEYEFEQMKEQKKVTVDSWIKDNAALARERASEIQNLKDEVAKLERIVIEQLRLYDVRYDCGWNIEHYRGCLKSLQRLVSMYNKPLDVLAGRIVVFAAFTGVSLEGHIMLYTGDVLNNWIDFIRNIPQHDAFRHNIPPYENALSQVLRNIKIGRRKFMPKQEAKQYASHLMKVTTTLGDYLTYNKYPATWPESLQDYEIVIESEAGPLMVSPTGQFIAPSTCPGSILIDFLTCNLNLAQIKMAQYKEHKHIEQQLIDKCKQKLNLKTLTKDDSVTPEKMIEALTNLLHWQLPACDNLELHITNYYSILTDGIICIPWDFTTR